MIDTHQHLMDRTKFSYGWAREFPALQEELGLERYHEAAEGCGIEGTVFMEVDVDEGQSGGEARHFCQLAQDPAHGIRAVVAAARPEEEGFERYLDSMAHARLVGIRRVLHTQPDDVSRSDLFRKNIRSLARRDLSFDLCVLQKQLPVAWELVQACPEVRFILDHGGNPDIASHSDAAGEGWNSWQEGVRALGACPNVFGKLSGLTTAARSEQRNAVSLRPYLETLLEAFGPTRLVWGGDWPVVNLGSGLAGWVALTKDLLQPLSAADRSRILSENARVIYRLP